MNANLGFTKLFAATALALVAVALSAPAQELTVRITPSQLQLKVGAETQLKAEVFDANGNPVEANVLFFSRNRRALQVRPDGTMLAISPGEYEVVARVATPADAGARRIRAAAGVPSGTVIVTVPQPALTSIEFTNLPDTVYVGTQQPLITRIIDETGSEQGRKQTSAALHENAANTESAQQVEAMLQVDLEARPIRRDHHPTGNVDSQRRQHDRIACEEPGFGRYISRAGDNHGCGLFAAVGVETNR